MRDDVWTTTAKTSPDCVSPDCVSRRVSPASPTSGQLEYRRQTRDAGGAIRWLMDVVDLEVLGPAGAAARVDLVVDETARSHIAYISGRDGKVRYATRYDR